MNKIILFMLAAAQVAAAGSLDFAESHRSEILHLTGRTLVPVQFHSEWYLVPGKPKEDWINQIHSKDRMTFQLTSDLNLDTLILGPHQINDEAVLYNRFFAPAEGSSFTVGPANSRSGRRADEHARKKSRVFLFVSRLFLNRDLKSCPDAFILTPEKKMYITQPRRISPIRRQNKDFLCNSTL